MERIGGSVRAILVRAFLNEVLEAQDEAERLCRFAKKSLADDPETVRLLERAYASLYAARVRLDQRLAG